MAVRDETVEGLKRRLDAGEALALLDVREPDERAAAAITAAPNVVDLHVPLGRVTAHLDALRLAAADRPLVVYCHHGVRSLIAARWLHAQGLPLVENLSGGIDAWARRIDPTVPRY